MVNAMTEICWSVTFGLYLKGLESCFTFPSTILGTTDTTSLPWCRLWVPAVWKACGGKHLACQDDGNKGA